MVGYKSSDELPLVKFFEEKPDNEIPERALLLELIVSTFLNKRNRTPDSSVAQVNIICKKNVQFFILTFCQQILDYIYNISKLNHNNKFVTISIIRNSLMRIFSISMFCEDTNVCKRITNEIFKTFINISESHSSDEIKYITFD